MSFNLPVEIISVLLPFADLFSTLVTLLAHHLQASFTWTTRQKSWYSKPLPTFLSCISFGAPIFLG